MNQPPLNNVDARYWDDLVEEFDFSPDEKREIRQGADHMIAEARARRAVSCGASDESAWPATSG
jgi:hypothetical protein